MASPDFSEYIDLTVNDLQPAELYAAALDYARTALPEFEPRSGSVEDALLQSFSLINSLYIAAANRIPNGTIEGVLRLFGLERREDGVSTLSASFSILTTAGSVLEGTSVSYTAEEDGTLVQYPFFVLETANAAAGSKTVNVTLESLTLGPLPAIPVGTPLTINQPSSELLSCVTTSAPSTAATAESDTEYLTRGVTYLNSLSNALCTAAQIESYILSTFPSVTRCKVYDLAYGSSTSPVAATTTTSTISGGDINIVIDCAGEDKQFFSFNTGLGINNDTQSVWMTTQQMYGSADVTKEKFPSGLMKNTGEVTDFNYSTFTVSITGIDVVTPTASATLGQTMVQLVSGLAYTLLNGTAPKLRTPDARGMYVIFAWGTEGQPISFETKQSIYDDISSRTPVGIDAFIHMVMPVELYVAVEIEVLEGYVASSVSAEVSDYLDSYFSPEYYPNWSEYLYRNEIVVKASEVTGVKRVVSAVMYLPTYGTGDMTTTTGSTFYNNNLMGELDTVNAANPQFMKFYFAGSMPSIKSNVSVYGS
jgi:hypothetical protein